LPGGAHITITVNEKILLFLLGYNKFRDSPEVPFAVSQKGIADGVDIRITHIPRAVQKLLEDDLISEFKTHFKGHLRKRKAYFLTEKGTIKSLELKDTVGSRMVTLKTADGQSVEKKMVEMYDIHGSAVSFFEFYQLCMKNSTLDEAALEKFKNSVVEKERQAECEFRDQSQNIPAHSRILGRDTERAVIDKWFDAEEQKVLVISGARGIGKSALASQAASTYKNDGCVFWMKFQPGANWEMLAISLSELAAANNYLKLDKYLKQMNNILPQKTIKILSEELEDIELLVVLDDIHNIVNGIPELGAWLSPILNLLPNWKIMITSHEPLPVELRSSKELEGAYSEIKLEGLDIDTCKKLIGADLSTSEFESIYNYTEGNPLYIKAITDLEAEGKLDLKNFRPEELSLLKFLKIQEELE
jgi:hypothetical protein